MDDVFEKIDSSLMKMVTQLVSQPASGDTMLDTQTVLNLAQSRVQLSGRSSPDLTDGVMDKLLEAISRVTDHSKHPNPGLRQSCSQGLKNLSYAKAALEGKPSGRPSAKKAS